MIRFVPASNIISHLQSSRKPRRISKPGRSFWSNKTGEKFTKTRIACSRKCRSQPYSCSLPLTPALTNDR
jgi:hypothetical protein